MNDFARSGGCAANALRRCISDKDEALCAAIPYFSGGSLNEIKLGWQDPANIGEMLKINFDHAIIASFAIVRASPDAEEMISGYNAAGKAEIKRVQAQKTEAIAGILAPFSDQIARAGLKIEQLADFIQTASMSLRNSAQDESHLRSLLAALKSTVMSLLKE